MIGPRYAVSQHKSHTPSGVGPHEKPEIRDGLGGADHWCIPAVIHSTKLDFSSSRFSDKLTEIGFLHKVVHRFKNWESSLLSFP